jgi:hypothetical protein
MSALRLRVVMRLIPSVKKATPVSVVTGKQGGGRRPCVGRGQPEDVPHQSVRAALGVDAPACAYRSGLAPSGIAVRFAAEAASGRLRVGLRNRRSRPTRVAQPADRAQGRPAAGLETRPTPGGSRSSGGTRSSPGEEFACALVRGKAALAQMP